MLHNDLVVPVDEDDREHGHEGKLEAHRNGLRHRAVSGFVFSKEGHLLIQRRAFSKYHSGGLWANSCCSHPRPAEPPIRCMERRLYEELGLYVAMLPFGTFSYRADVGHGMIENEFVHGFVGVAEGELTINPSEVHEVAWVHPSSLVHLASSVLAPWFKIYIEQGFLAEATDRFFLLAEAAAESQQLVMGRTSRTRHV